MAVETAAATERASARALARASGLNLAARAVSGVSALGLAALSTNLLDTHDRGVYAVLSTWAGIGLTVLAGGTPVLAADLIHGRRAAPLLHGVAGAVALAAAALLLPLALLASRITDAAPASALLWTAVLTAALVYANFEMAIAQARGDVVRVSLTMLGLALFPLAATAVVALAVDATITTLVAAWAVGALVTAGLQLAGVVAAGQLAVRRAWRAAADLVRRSGGVALANGTNLLVARIDVLVVAVVLSAGAAGVYSIAVALSTGLLLLSRSLLTATYRSIMGAPPAEVGERLASALHHSVIVVVAGGVLSLPVVVLAAGTVFGAAYADVWEPYAVLLPASACACVAEMLGHVVLTRLERHRTYVLVAMAMLVLNGALAIVGASALGLVGAACSTTVTYACYALVLLVVCSRALGVPVRELAVPRRSDLAVYRRLVGR